MPEKLMIDSGAFSVWNAGKTIDLDEYIAFCKARPNLSIVVNLDVIPPKGAKLTDAVKDETCQRGWDNYMKMIRKIPMEKVIPVFHRGEDIKWLEKYLDFGCPYIGLSPRFDSTHKERRFKFLADCAKVLVGSDGKCCVKTHGFAVTNHRMMSMFPWYSVDSATWTQIAAWGAIMVPRRRRDEWDFVSPPYRVFTSVTSTKRHVGDMHILAMKVQRPQLHQIVLDWLEENGVGLGKHRIVMADGKKPKNVIERWADRQKTKILKISERGVTNCDQIRRWLNALYYQRVNHALPTVENLYLAGNGPIPPTEIQIRYRLRSFVEGPQVSDWLYKRLGVVKRPMQFPFEVYNGKRGTATFTFKE